MDARELIERLNLVPLPEEGGYYRETYRADAGLIAARAYGIDANTDRCPGTAIYYLVVPESFSALHRVRSDEMFHFYAGDAAEMIQIDEAGELTRFVLGNDIAAGQTPQVLVRRGVWQGVRLLPGGKWALMGCTVAPGFEFEDFEVAPREQLQETFPQHRKEIERFTRGEGERR